MNDVARKQLIQQYFDADSVQYLRRRYPTEASNCDQLSYLVRRQHVLDMLQRSGVHGRVLDIGCGPGVLTAELMAREWRVTGIDLSAGMLAAASKSMSSLPQGSIGFAAAEATHLPFRDGVFDAVLCIGVISYVDDVAALLGEVNRVLRPGGQAVLQISNTWGVAELDGRLRAYFRRIVGRRQDATEQFHAQVLRSYRPRAFEARCAAAGLQRREFRFYNFRPPRAMDRLAPALSLRAGRQLEVLGGSRLATGLASGYLARFERRTASY
jgi:ubiquinone/menaquinone biosynthesis C-methylase UbiE